MKTAIILPAYNVAKRISWLLAQLHAYKERTIIIDDGSLDDTYTLVLENGFQCLHHTQNQGVSAAIQTGIAFAKLHGFDSVIILDADGQHNPEAIVEFEQKLRDHDIVVGNRFHTIQNAPTNKLASNGLASILINLVFDSNLIDISCGFKAFHITDWLLDIIAQSNSYSFIFELLVESLRRNRRIACVNIDCIYFYDEFLHTGREEIESFLLCMHRYCEPTMYEYLGLENLSKNVQNKCDFSLVIGEFGFYGYYIEKADGYLLQVDPEKMSKYLVGVISDPCKLQVEYHNP